MKVRITAKRWDEPVELEADEIAFRHIEGNAIAVALDGEWSSVPIELNSEFGESVEIVA